MFGRNGHLTEIKTFFDEMTQKPQTLVFEISVEWQILWVWASNILADYQTWMGLVFKLLFLNFFTEKNGATLYQCVYWIV
jgi:hypothetical protein